MERAQRVIAAGETLEATVEKADGRKSRPETGYWRAGWHFSPEKRINLEFLNHSSPSPGRLGVSS